jgi:hypothetical protein
VRYAEAHRKRGELPRALDWLDQAVTVFRDAADQWSEADALDRRGQVLREVGRVEEATTSFRAAMALFDALDDPRAAELRARLDHLG